MDYTQELAAEFTNQFLNAAEDVEAISPQLFSSSDEAAEFVNWCLAGTHQRLAFKDGGSAPAIT